MTTIERIFDTMDKKNIKQIELADYLNISKTAISEWKKGNSKSYNKYIDKIAEFLHVTTDYLLGNDLIQIPQIDLEEDTIMILSRGGNNKIIKISPEQKEKVKLALKLALDQDEDLDF